MTGGSGLFIKAVCEGLDVFPEVPDKIRKEINDLYKIRGINFLQDELKVVDPDYYEKVDLNNPMRIIRALEVFRSSGKPFSSFLTGKKASRSFRPIFIKLEMDREKLYNRINQRVDQMIALGLEKEAKDLYPFKHLTSLQTVGYQEFFDYFDQKISFEEAVRSNQEKFKKIRKKADDLAPKGGSLASFST